VRGTLARLKSVERDLAGNAIDFFVEVLGRSFNDAMREITASQAT
jgi:hypothetical protein